MPAGTPCADVVRHGHHTYLIKIALWSGDIGRSECIPCHAPIPTCQHCVQSLVLAPLFVWLELLFVLGYRPALHAELLRSIEANVATIDQSKQPLLKEPQQIDAAAAEPADAK